MKLYAKKATANAIASKMSKKGTEHEAVEHEGQFAVVPVGTSPADMEVENEGPVATPEELGAPAIIEGEDGQPVTNPEVIGKTEQPADEIVTVYIPGARLTPCYAITPPIGTSKKGPLERWIERARCKSAEYDGKGVTLTVSTRELKKRGVKAEDYMVPEAA